MAFIKHIGVMSLLVPIALQIGSSRPASADDDAPTPLSYKLDPLTYQSAVITEVMIDPVGADVETGQWIEIQNLTDDPVNLQGMVLLTNQGGLPNQAGFHVISPAMEMVLEPGDVRVLARATDTAVNGGVTADYVYGNDLLLKADGYILLAREQDMVDWVLLSSETIGSTSGRTISLEPPAPQGSSFKEWCLGRMPYGNGDLGTPGQINSYCDSDGDGLAEDQGDCNDDDAAIRPGTDEACNGIDDDCDGETDEDLVMTNDLCPKNGVCDRITVVCNGTSGFACIYPGDWQADETWCDNLDNDCDGATDEDQLFGVLVLGDPCVGPGVCGKGTVVCSHTTKAPTCSTLPDGTEPKDSPEACNGTDDDCDDRIDNGWDVGAKCVNGYGVCSVEGTLVCNGPDSVVCNATPTEPGPELCGDGQDNDCDNDIDEDFDIGATCSVGIGACRVVGSYRCSDDRLEQVCRATAKEPSFEICGDKVDNDCDGSIDEEDCATSSVESSGSCSASGTPGSTWPVLMILPLLVVIRRREQN